MEQDLFTAEAHYFCKTGRELYSLSVLFASFELFSYDSTSCDKICSSNISFFKNGEEKCIQTTIFPEILLEYI